MESSNIIDYTIRALEWAEETNDEIQDYLECGVCCNVIFKPVECKSCETAFCKTCMDDWLDKCLKKGQPQSCPNRCDHFIIGPIHRVFKDILNKRKVVCPNRKCQEEVKYEDLITHIKKCNESPEEIKEIDKVDLFPNVGGGSGMNTMASQFGKGSSHQDDDSDEESEETKSTNLLQVNHSLNTLNIISLPDLKKSVKPIKGYDFPKGFQFI